MSIHYVNQNDIEEFRRLVRESPVNPLKSWQRTKRPTKTKFVAEIAADVIQMRRKGYSTEEIAQLISTHLFEISPNGLRSLLTYIGVSIRTSLAAYREIDSADQGASQDAAREADFVHSLLHARELLLAEESCVPGFVEVLVVGDTAKTKLKKMPATDVALFRQAVGALEPGRQTIMIADELDHVAQKLVGLGLFREFPVEESGVYEIPEEVARIVRVPREARAMT
jgi:hypothetical protein